MSGSVWKNGKNTGDENDVDIIRGLDEDEVIVGHHDLDLRASNSGHLGDDGLPFRFGWGDTQSDLRTNSQMTVVRTVEKRKFVCGQLPP